MKKLFYALVILATFAYAKTGCVLVQSGKLDVTWKAFKTPEKIGVGGKFTKVNFKPAAKEGKNFRSLLVGSTVSIDTTQIDSGNQGRDVKLLKFFFGKLEKSTIEGKITDIKADPYIKGKPRTGKITVMLDMNGKDVETVMNYHYFEERFSAKGSIDLAAFAALDALSSINQACYDLHKGKTWADVEIGFETDIKATLCHVEVK